MHAIRPTPIFLAAALVACGGASSTPGGSAPSPLPTTGTPVPGAMSFAFAYREGRYSYETHSEVTIAVKGDSLARQEPVTTTLVATYELLGGGAAPAVRGAVESFVVTSGGRVRSTSQAVPVPVAFEGMVGGALRSTALPARDSAAACGTPNDAVLAAAARTLVPVPAVLAQGVDWADTLRTTVCRGDVPIVTVTASRYRVEGTARVGGVEAVQVQRATSMTIAGSGMSRGRTVAISGAGTGVSVLAFDPAAGRFLESTGEFTTELTVDAAGTRQTLVQRERMVTKGRP